MKNQVTVPGFFKENIAELRLTLPNGSHIFFKSADKPNSLYGEDVYAVVFDEFTRAKEDAWVALRSTVTATKGKVKFIGNCRGRKGWYAKLAQKAKIYTNNTLFATDKPEYEYFKINAYDAVKAGILDIEEVEQAKRDLPEHVFRELYLAEPSDDGGNPFGLQYIDACTVDGLSEKAPICYGIDLAKSVDWTVVIGLDEDGRVSHFQRWQGPWHVTKDRLSQLDRIPTCIDSTGVGDPIVEDMQIAFLDTGGELVEGFQFTNASKQRLMLGLATGIQNQQVSFPENVIKDELEVFEYQYSSTGVKYSAPDGFHDDCVCALALAYRKFRELELNPTGGAPMPIVGGRQF